LQTPQQEANAAALQQVRQAALVLRWFVSEVQLLSPEAQREALAIPMRILSKLGGRITARAVRAVLTPSSTGSTAPSRTAVLQQDVGAGRTAAGKGQELQVEGVVNSSTSKGSRSNGSGSSSGVVMAPVRPGGLTEAAAPQPSNGSVVGSSVGSNGSSRGSIGQVVYSNGVNGSSRDVRSSSSGSSSPVSTSSLSKEALVAAAVTTPLPSDSKGGVKGGRMVALKEP
jgi:hypothetical protein